MRYFAVIGFELLLKIIALAGMLVFANNASAQTYILPDTNLRNKLISDYPALMSGNELNITLANSYAGSLNLDNANINDASGIQYFLNIPHLNLNYNNLSSLPDISGLTKLNKLYVTNNKLTSFPDISTLKNLFDFQVQNNLLTTLPALNGLTSLSTIYCNDNELISFPEISALTNLSILDIGDNKFGTSPDLSTLVNLKQLHIHNTGIDTIKGLASLAKLEILFAWGNKIRDLSALNANTKLKVFQVGDNELTALPILYNKPLFYVDFSNNRLSFEDILPLDTLSNFDFFTYIPQKKIELPNYVVREKDNFSIKLNIDKDITSNVYNWSKNGILIERNKTGVKVFNSVAFADSGNYWAAVTNPNLPGLTLQTSVAKVSVKPCIELNGFTVNVVAENCSTGTNLNFSAVDVKGGTPPITYSMVTVAKDDSIPSFMPTFSSLSSGVYRFVISDSKMCKVSREVVVKSPPACEAVFSPNMDGVMDTYFIDEPGKARIYDLGRNLIAELTTPAVWNGTKSDGSPAEAGYYAIVINESKVVNITLVK